MHEDGARGRWLAMTAGLSVVRAVETDRSLTEAEVRRVLQEGLGRIELDGAKVLVVIPDGTRTAPIPMIYQLLDEMLHPRVDRLDYLIALGTHPAMDDAARSRLVGARVTEGRTARSRIFNHRWERPDAFATLGTIAPAEVAQATAGAFEVEVPVRLNRMVDDPEGDSPYRHVIVCGPVFPHEVAGFSGGNKYFVPGVAGPEVIDATHWVGALMTSRRIIGVADTPVRRLIDRAASFISTPRSLIALVLHGDSLHGVFVGGMDTAWLEATGLSAELDIVWVERPFDRVLSVMPRMYDDLWTGAKGMYKLEPAVADGGEVVIYAPHITEVSYVHGRVIDEVGYHVRDYFTTQWDRFKHLPWGVLAHSTHLRGDGSYVGGVEQARIRVTLATGIPEERCRRIGLGYLDPRSVDPERWADREDEGVLLVRRAGEQLYRVRSDDGPTEGVS